MQIINNMEVSEVLRDSKVNLLVVVVEAMETNMTAAEI